MEDSLQISWRAEEVIPQSTSLNLLVAVAFAKKVASGAIDPNQKVSLDYLERFNLKPGNHAVWKTYLRLVKKQTDSVSYHDIVSGLVSFDSEANFLFLYDLIGSGALSSEIEFFGLTTLDGLYPFPASRLTCSLYDSATSLSTHLAEVKSLSSPQYELQARQAFETLKNDHNRMFSQFLQLEAFDQASSEIWYQRLPKGSAADFHRMLRAIYHEKVLPKKVFDILVEVLEDVIMQSPESRLLFRRCLSLNGSTPYSLHLMAYARLITGSEFYFTFFLHGLTPKEYSFVAENFSEFRFMLLTSESFRQSFVSQMKELQ